MPKRIIGVSARLIDCAKQEFLEKGYINASIRSIAEKADTSARAVYTRFKDKEALFSAIVEPAANELIKLFSSHSNKYWNSTAEFENMESSLIDSAEIYIKMIDYTYDNLDEFKLILKCSNGTKYSNFIEELTVINCNNLKNYGEDILIKNVRDNTTTKLIHVITHAFYSGLFEPVLHDMTREEAHFYVKKLCSFFIGGVQKIIN